MPYGDPGVGGAPAHVAISSNLLLPLPSLADATEMGGSLVVVWEGKDDDDVTAVNADARLTAERGGDWCTSAVAVDIRDVEDEVEGDGMKDRGAWTAGKL